MLGGWRGRDAFFVYLIVEANLILVKGNEALLRATPVECIQLGLGQPGNDQLCLQLHYHGLVMYLEDKVLDDTGVAMIKVLVYNQPHIVRLQTFLHHTEHSKHLVSIQLGV